MSIFDNNRFDGLDPIDFLNSNTNNPPDPMEMKRRRLAILHMKDMLQEASGRVAPDTFGADAIFVRTGFISPEMEDDFPVIAAEFLKNVPSALQEKEAPRYADASFSGSDPISAFCRKILSEMLYAAKSGDAYTIQLFQHLYRLYYKKEYKLLKHFNRIKSSELLSIADEQTYDFVYSATLSRLLTICPFFHIKIDPDCSFIYLMLADENNNISNCSFEEKDFELRDGEFAKMREEFQKIAGYGEARSLYDMSDIYNDHDIFRSMALRYLGYHEDYAKCSNSEFIDAEREMSLTLMILKRCFPKRTFTFEELQHYAADFNAVCALVCASDLADTYMDALLGYPDPCAKDESLFQPSKFTPNLPQAKKTTDTKNIQKTTEQPVPKPAEASYKQEELLAEIDSLREKLHAKEHSLQHMTDLYLEARKKLQSSDSFEEKYHAAHDELLVLRNHLYSMTAEDIAIKEADLAEMTAFLKTKRITIIGGHDNWTARLKATFPKWNYLGFKSTTTIRDNILDNADYVYFFTDFIKHHVYYRFINIVRDKNIPFGYIHSSNIQNNIAQIYHDLLL